MALQTDPGETGGAIIARVTEDIRQELQTAIVSELEKV